MTRRTQVVRPCIHAHAPDAAAGPARVLYVFGSLDPRTGGPANSAPNIWISAARAGVKAASAFTVERPLPAGEARTIERIRAAGIEPHAFAVSHLWQLRRWGVSVPLALWVLRHARDYDLVHAHGAWMVSSLVGWAAARLSGTPFVLTPHEHLTEGDVMKGDSPVRRSIKACFRRLYLRSSDLIIAASEVEAQASGAATAAAPFEVLYHPVVAEAPAPSGRREFAPRGRLRAGYLGRFDPKKQIERAIEALALAPGVTLAIAGGGDPAYESQLKERAAAAGVADRIRWLGFLPAPALADFFGSLDVLLMPSRFEGFGMVAAEALSHGVPVIVSPSSGIGELVARYECGRVVAPEPRAIAAALAAFQEDPSGLHRCAERAAALCREELSFERYGANLVRRYRALLSASKPAKRASVR